MVMGLTQLLTQMSTRNFLGGKGRPVPKADNLTAIYEPTGWKCGEPRQLTTLWASMAYYRDTFTFLTFCLNHQGSRDSAVGIATSYVLEDRGVGVRVPIESRIFSMSRQAVGPTQPPLQQATGALSPG
jgi:hypothetical protein